MKLSTFSIDTIDPLNAPDFSELNLDNFFTFTDVRLDTSRDVILDETNSVLSVPYISNQINSSAKIKWPKIKIKIKIAKMNVKEGSGCKSCVDCIGFRCRVSAQVIPVLASEIEFDDDMLARNSRPLSKNREELFYANINKVARTIDYYPINNLEWQAY